MRSLNDMIALDDFSDAADRVLPRLVRDYINGGVEDEHALKRNLSAFAEALLIPRYLVHASKPCTQVQLWNQTYAWPFGIAPMGLQGFARPGMELMLARAAHDAKIPFVLSGAGTSTVEQVAEIAGPCTWFQLYVARDRNVSADLVRRASDAGIQVLVLTVDAPVHSKRERDWRNGFGPAPRLGLHIILDMLLHVRWLVRQLHHGLPTFANWAPYAPSQNRAVVNRFFTQQIPFTQTWDDVRWLRDLWPGKLVIKGILHPDDAIHAFECQADGIIVSNHGGRVLDAAPSALHQLSLIRQEVGPEPVLMLDGGIRRGSDVLKACQAGANFVWMGRPALHAAAAFGLPGAYRVIAILEEEIRLCMAQCGWQNMLGTP